MICKAFFNPNPFFDDKDPEGSIETYDWDRLKKPVGSDFNPPWIPSSHTKIVVD